MKSLGRAWSQSKLFRIFLVLSLIWFALRLLVQVVYAAGLFSDLTGDDGLPMDLPVYLGAAQSFLLKQTLYPQDLSDSTYHYPYSPPFAMLSTILLWFPARWVALVGTLLSALVYLFLYMRWGKIFQKLDLVLASEKLIWTLPVWLVFSAFWGGVVFLNIGVFAALVATLLIESILDERLGWSSILLTFLLISKIMWAFPLALPLLLGRRKFFLQLILWSGAIYLALVGISVLVVGPYYLVEQYAGYINHLQRLGTEFPWHTRNVIPFIGYNHSIKQSMVFFLGTQSWVYFLTTMIKVLILFPFAFVCWQIFVRSQSDSGEWASSSQRLQLIFVLYLAAFIWLDIVWEVLLGIAIFPYLLSILQSKREHIFLWGLFLLYALTDVIQFLSYMIGGDSVVIMQGAYVLTDPAMYLPLTMLVIFTFYYFLLRELWRSVNLSTPRRV